MLQSLLRDSITYAISTFISRGLSFLLIPLYTRILTPADYGALDMLIIFGNIVNLTVSLEVYQGAARYCTDKKNGHQRMLYASSALWFTLLCYSIFVALALALTPYIAPVILGKTGLESDFRIGIVYLGLNGVFILIHNQFRWELRSYHYAVTSVLLSISTASAALILMYLFKLGLGGLLLGMTFGVFIGILYGIWHLRNSFNFYFCKTCLKRMLAFSTPLVPASIAVFISFYIDRLMLNYYLSLTEVGIYALGFRLSSVIGLVMSGFQNALTPLIYNYHKDKKTPHQLALIFQAFMSFALLAFLGLSLFSKEILWLTTNPNYYSAANLIIFLIPAILLSNMYIFAPGIDITKKTHMIVWINLGGAVINTVLNWLMIPVFGPPGAASATLIGHLCVFTVYMMFSQRLYYVPHNWRLLVSSTGVTGCVAMAGTRIDGVNIFSYFIKVLIFIAISILFLKQKMFRLRDLKKIFKQ